MVESCQVGEGSGKGASIVTRKGVVSVHEEKSPSEVLLVKQKGDTDLQVVTSSIYEEQVKDVSEEEGYSRDIREEGSKVFLGLSLQSRNGLICLKSKKAQKGLIHSTGGGSTDPIQSGLGDSSHSIDNRKKRVKRRKNSEVEKKRSRKGVSQ